MDKSDVNKNSKLINASGISSYTTAYKNNNYKAIIKPFQPVNNFYCGINQNYDYEENKKISKKFEDLYDVDQTLSSSCTHFEIDQKIEIVKNLKSQYNFFEPKVKIPNNNKNYSLPKINLKIINNYKRSSSPTEIFLRQSSKKLEKSENKKSLKKLDIAKKIVKNLKLYNKFE